MMKNVIIMGSGRSGTSMAAGLFRNSGADFGDVMLDPSVSNPVGYYEDQKVNNANNEVISQILGRDEWSFFQRLLKPPVFRDARCWWMATPPKLRPVTIGEHTKKKMLTYMERQPFCLKDPRFSSTLEAWRPHIPENTVYLVVFREPAKVIDSMLRDAREKYDPPLPTRRKDAELAYLRVYNRLLDEWSNTTEWMFLDYQDLISGKSFEALQAFTGAEIDGSEIDSKLSRAQAQKGEGNPRIAACEVLYDRLKARAAEDLKRHQPVHTEARSA